MSEEHDFSLKNEFGPNAKIQFIDLAQPCASAIATLGPRVAFMSENYSPFHVERVGDEIENHYIWIFSVEGEGELTIPGVSYKLPAGTVLAVPSWYPRRLKIIGKYWKRITFSVMDSSQNDFLKYSSVNSIKFTPMRQLNEAVENYFFEVNSLNSDREQAMQHYASLIALYLKRAVQAVTGDGDYQMYDRFGKLWMDVNAQLEFHWTIETLAEKFYVSPSYFYQKCRQLYGCGPMKYISELRMKRAEELLMNTQYSLAQIATSVGYSTEYTFSSAFYKNRRIRPGAFRKKFGSMV